VLQQDLYYFYAYYNLLYCEVVQMVDAHEIV